MSKNKKNNKKESIISIHVKKNKDLEKFDIIETEIESIEEKLGTINNTRQSNIDNVTIIYTYELISDVFDLVFKKCENLHGQHFKLAPIIEDIINDKYSNLSCIINFEFFSELLCSYLNDYKKNNPDYNKNIFFRIEKENIVYIHITFPNQKIKPPNLTFNPWKITIFVMPFVLLLTLAFNPYSSSFINYTKVSFCIFSFLYIWLLILTRNFLIHSLLVSTYLGVTFFIKALDENGMIFFPYEKHFYLSIACLSFVLINMILIYGKILSFIGHLKVYNNLGKTLSKKRSEITPDDITNLIIKDHEIKEKQLKINDNLVEAVNKELSRFGFSFDLKKIMSANNFLIISTFSSITFLFFIIYGPTEKDYFFQNEKECSLLLSNEQISKINDISGRVLVLGDKLDLKRNLAHSYNQNQLRISPGKFWPFSLIPTEKYIYKENCNN